MFNRLEGKLQQRLHILKSGLEEQKRTEKAIQTFLNEKGYPQAIITYNTNEKCVVIETQAKVFANELTMTLGDVAEALRKEGIFAKKIVIK